MMKKKSDIIITCVILLLFISSVTYSQTERTYRGKYENIVKLLEFAKDVETSFPNIKAQELLTKADRLINDAVASALSGKYLLANQQLNEAVKLIELALQMILHDPIRRENEKLKELILQVESIVAECSSKKAEQFLQKVKEHHTIAVQSYQAKRYQLALEHLRLGIFLAHKAIDLCRNQSVQIKESSLEEKERVEQLLRKAEQTVQKSQNPTAKKFYRLAEKQLQKAQQLMDNENYIQANDNYHKATRLLLRAIDIASGNGKQAEIQTFDEIIALDELIESLQNTIESVELTENNRIIFLEGQVLALQQNAHKALEENDYKTAQLHAQMARKLIERALQVINKKSDTRYTSRLQDELIQLTKNLEDISHKAKESNNEEASELISLANKAQNRAQTLYDRGNQGMALAVIAVANKFAYAAERLIETPGTVDSDRQAVKTRLDDLAEQLQILKLNRPDLDPRDKILLREAENSYNIATEYFERGYVHVANECVDVALKQVDRIRN